MGAASNILLNNMTKNSPNILPAAPDAIIGLVEGKDQQELCREVLAIGDTMDVLRGKWTVEVLTAIVCGNTHFKEILASIHGLSDKVLAERLRTMQDDRLIARCEYPTPNYSLTDHGRDLFALVYCMSTWGLDHRRLMLG